MKNTESKLRLRVMKKQYLLRMECNRSIQLLKRNFPQSTEYNLSIQSRLRMIQGDKVLMLIHLKKKIQLRQLDTLQRRERNREYN